MRPCISQHTRARLRRWRGWRWAVLLLWLLPWAPAGAAAGTPVVLRDELPVQQVWSALTVLADPSRVLTVQEVMADPSQWHPPPGTSGT